MNRLVGTRGGLFVAVAAAVGVALAGCSSNSSGDNEDTGSAIEETQITTEDSGTSEAGSLEGRKIAYLSASSANTWLQSSKNAMQEVADEYGIEIVEYDAQFTPGEQLKQVQDVISAGDFSGLIIAAMDGAAVIPDLQAAIQAGVPVVTLNQVVGEDLDTAEPQFEGSSASIMVPPTESGRRIGQLTVQACADLDPCKVVYFYGIKGTPLDTALKLGFDEVTSQYPSIQVVAEAEADQLGPDVALSNMQDLLQSSAGFNVVVGDDTAMEGAELALTDAGVIDQVRIVGFGGSETGIAAVKDGRWFGTLYGAPATEGRLAMEALVAAIRDGVVTGGVNPLEKFPNGGLITADNADDYTPEFKG